MIPKNDNAALDAIGITFSVKFDRLNTHSGKDCDVRVPVHVVPTCNKFVGVLIGKTIIFLAVRSLPVDMIAKFWIHRLAKTTGDLW